MRNAYRPQTTRSRSGGLILAGSALLLGAACTSTTGPGPAAEIRQADLSDASGVPGVPAASREYSAFQTVTTEPTPPARSQMGFVFDPVRGKSILFGGRGFTDALPDTWQYDGKWSLACDTPCAGAPGSRTSAAMAFAEGRGVAVMFGGYRSPSALCETWEWDGAHAAWRSASTPSCTDGEGPAARRFFHAMAGLGDDVVMFGGTIVTASGNAQSNAIYGWDGQTWTDLCDGDCKSAPAPAPRAAPTLVRAHTAARDVVLLFGGYTGAGAKNDLWQFDAAAGKWTELCVSAACKAAAPSPRGDHGAAFDSIRGTMFVHGGCATIDCNPAFSDAYEYDVATDSWRGAPRSIDPTLPDGKYDFGVTFDAKRGRVVEFGGTKLGTPLDTTVEYYTRGAVCAKGSECDTGVCTKSNANDALGTCAEACTGASSAAGACVGGFRCDTACAATCQTCLSIPGVCTAITSGPDDEAGDAPASHCSGTKTCTEESGVGVCLLIAGQTCSNTADCASGNCSRYGYPVCAEANCGDRPCRPASSAGTCTTLGAGHYVAECLGRACGTDGFCLEKCAADEDCDTEYYCDDATHDCKHGKRFGAPCTSLGQCGQGTCVDGVCCSDACTNNCEKCGTDGVCHPIGRNEVPSGSHAPCLGADSGVCSGYCDGVSAGCTYPERPCGDGQCVETDWRLGGVCDHGECISTEDPRNCGAFSCDEGSCNTECSSNAECRRGAVCDPTQGVCNDQGVTCGPDGISVKTPTGTLVSCDGYPCTAGACAFKGCDKNQDCAPGYACSADHRCVEAGTPGEGGTAPPSSTADGGVRGSGPTGTTPHAKDAGGTQAQPKDGVDGGGESAPGDSGCAVSPARRGHAGIGWFAGIALAVVFVRRRRAAVCRA